MESVKENTNRYIKYIESIKINGQQIITMRCKTGFLGLIIGLKSLILLAESLFEERYLQFLLTYKLSQDHVETFFSYIRRCGGWNNNPTARQFKSALKKLYSHVDINIIFTANCTPKDDTALLKIDLTNDFSAETEKRDFIWDCEHDYGLQSLISLNEYKQDMLSYIAGFVVRCIENKLKCSLCIKGLQQELTPSYLQKRKAYGRLFKASDNVIKICKAAEIRFKMNEASIYSKNIIEKLVLDTVKILPVNDLFKMFEHAYEQAPLADHRNELIRLILKTFFKLRIYH